jgi:microcystin-dependent protein
MPGTTPRLQLPYPTPDDTVDVPRDVKALADKLDPMGTVPVGYMGMWPTSVAPTGWLLMQGQQVDAATYPGLAALFGVNAGLVTIPDMRDLFPVGAGANAVGATGGAASVGLVEANNGPHAHLFSGTTGARDRSQNHGHGAHAYGYSVAVGGGPSAYWALAAGLPYEAPTSIAIDGADPADHYHPFSGGTDVRGSGVPHENRPPFRAVNFIIRAG